MTNLADEMKEQFNQHKQLIQDMDNKLLDFNNKITHLEDQLKNTTNSIREKDCLPLELSVRPRLINFLFGGYAVICF